MDEFAKRNRKRQNEKMKSIAELKYVRTALYVPASNARALAKARDLDADMLIIDLEDSVPQDEKDGARQKAIEEIEKGFAEKTVVLRLNATDSRYFEQDLKAAHQVDVDCLVIPKVEGAFQIDKIAESCSYPLLAMVESAKALYNVRAIAAHNNVAGLIIGANDLCFELGIRPGPNREGLEFALQSTVLAAKSQGKIALDAVCNNLDDLSGFKGECQQGRRFGFTGKTVIHPSQIVIANETFGPSAEELDDARALIMAASDGAQRFRGRMIENMHVEDAKRLIERAKATAARTLSGES
jgi:(3S)-malyl-CoA thioesterase